MPGRIPPSNATPPSNPAQETTKKDTSGEWNGIKISTVPPTDHTKLRRESESDADSGVGSPLSDRSISPVSGDIHSTTSPNTFSFAERDLNKLALSGTAKLAKTKLGKGAHGSVYKVIVKDEKGTEHFLALKTFRHKAAIEREKTIMASIGAHPNIVAYYGEAEIEGEKRLLYEYLPGYSLERLSQELLSTPMPAGERINALKHLEQQKLAAIAHSGESEIVHSDLKPSNFLCDPQTGNVKLIDFGEAVSVGEKFAAGHEDYAAPETLKTLGSRSWGPEAKITMDSYPAGQMLYQGITATADGMGSPFMFGANVGDITQASERPAKIFRTVMAMQSSLISEKEGSDVQVLDTSPKAVRERTCQLTKNALQATDKQDHADDDIQATALELEPDILQASLLINGLMHINPEKRSSAREALAHPWFQQNPADREQAIETLSRLDP